VIEPATQPAATQPGAAEPRARRLTARGAATKARITQAAADLMYLRGVSATTLDDVRMVSGTSKSQLYQHFPDKDALVGDVIALQSSKVLSREHERLDQLRSFRGLQRWRDALVRASALRDGAHGCVLGSLASEVADSDEQARVALAADFARWESLIAAGLRRMQDNGSLRPDADPDRLAVGLMAALQGGYLLAQTAHDVQPMAIALDMALDQVKTYQPD
jgi:AcrR family transcriptional regulator